MTVSHAPAAAGHLTVQSLAELMSSAAHGLAQLGAAQAAAACQAELGPLLLDGGDLLSTRPSLSAALGLLDAAAAPSLAARLRLGLAEIATVLDERDAAGEELRRARALYPLAPGGAAGDPEAVERRGRRGSPRPPLLRPARWLSDRVLRRCGELGDPIGAARGL